MSRVLNVTQLATPIQSNGKMAEQVTEVVSTTSLPKTPLSYRWVIHDAKALLEGNKEGLRSPTFYATLLLEVESDSDRKKCKQMTSSWHLYIEQGSISLWQGKSEIYLDEHDSDSGSEVCIPRCTFSIINSENKEVLHTISGSSDGKFKIGEEWRGLAVKGYFTSTTEISNYLRDDKLAVQIDASVVSLCFGAVTESYETEEVHKLPLDVLPLYRGLKSLLDNEMFVDVTLKCEEREFKAHKAVLASQSPVFKSMFETDMKEKKSSVIEITDTDPEVVSGMLTYLYTYSVPNLVEELLIIANKYQIAELHELCEVRLIDNLTVNNVVDLLILADMHNAPYLKHACLWFVFRNSTEVHRTSQWDHLKQKFPSLLIEVIEYSPYQAEKVDVVQV